MAYATRRGIQVTKVSSRERRRRRRRRGRRRRCETSKTIWEAEAVRGIFLVLLREDDNYNDKNDSDIFISV